MPATQKFSRIQKQGNVRMENQISEILRLIHQRKITHTF